MAAGRSPEDDVPVTEGDTGAAGMAGLAPQWPFVVCLRPWRVEFVVDPGVRVIASRASLARAVATALTASGAPAPASVTIVLSGDAELSRLNAVHMGKPGPTDVLSFPLLPPGAFPAHEGGPPAGAPGEEDRGPAFRLPRGVRTHLGDIVISVERAVEQAHAGRGGLTGDVRWAAADELLLLVTHGTLHLCGWDHADPAEEAAMRALERRLRRA